MKCPKCGFVSYPGLAQCKKCGHRFVPEPRKEKSSLLSLFSGSTVPTPPPAKPSPAAPPPPVTETSVKSEVVPLHPAEPEAALAVPQAPPAVERPPAPEEARPWREEISERVENFRRRRARLLEESDPSINPTFDFSQVGESEVGAKVLEFPQAEGSVDVALGGGRESVGELPLLDSHPLDKTGGGVRILTSAAVEAGELTLDHRIVEAEPVEIVLESSPAMAESAALETAPFLLPVASLGRRFLAGIADALVLVAGVGLFALIFWRAGAHVTPRPLNIAVLGLIGLLIFLVYFGLFTALTASTPGLLWMGLEVRNFDGGAPSARESCWRAFGYLVSTSALMLGFVWSLVDSDGFTWHDRMCRTFIATDETRRS